MILPVSFFNGQFYLWFINSISQYIITNHSIWTFPYNVSTAIVLLTSITFPWTLVQSNVLNLRLKKFFRVIVQPHRNFAKRSDFEDRVIQQTWKWLDNDLRRDARFHERSIKNREKKCGENWERDEERRWGTLASRLSKRKRKE